MVEMDCQNSMLRRRLDKFSKVGSQAQTQLTWGGADEQAKERSLPEWKRCQVTGLCRNASSAEVDVHPVCYYDSTVWSINAHLLVTILGVMKNVLLKLDNRLQHRPAVVRSLGRKGGPLVPAGKNTDQVKRSAGESKIRSRLDVVQCGREGTTSSFPAHDDLCRRQLKDMALPLFFSGMGQLRESHPDYVCSGWIRTRSPSIRRSSRLPDHHYSATSQAHVGTTDRARSSLFHLGS